MWPVGDHEGSVDWSPRPSSVRTPPWSIATSPVLASRVTTVYSSVRPSGRNEGWVSRRSRRSGAGRVKGRGWPPPASTCSTSPSQFARDSVNTIPCVSLHVPPVKRPLASLHSSSSLSPSTRTLTSAPSIANATASLRGDQKGRWAPCEPVTSRASSSARLRIQSRSPAV